MKCRYEIDKYEKTNRIITNTKCKRIKGLVSRCDKENCDYIKGFKK